MSDPATTERFILLEMKMAYQEKLLQELSDLLREKGREIEQLGARLARLEAAAAAAGEEARLPHERPPHY